MRQAARKVALENSRLRSLLASRGVTDEEVNRYLASLDNQASGGAPATALGVRADATDLPPPVSDSDLLRPVRDGVPHNGTAACALETLAAAADIADVSVQQACCGPQHSVLPLVGETSTDMSQGLLHRAPQRHRHPAQNLPTRWRRIWKCLVPLLPTLWPTCTEREMRSSRERPWDALAPRSVLSRILWYFNS